DGKIKKYSCPEDILQDYYDMRLKMYKKRKKYLIDMMENELAILKYRVKFIKKVVNEELIIFKQKFSKVESRLEELKFPRLSTKLYDDEENKSYEYLKMDWHVFTTEKAEKLNQEYERIKIKEIKQIK